MAAIKIDLTRYLELLEKEKKLKNQGKSLSDENEEKYSELLQYEMILANDVVFRQREKYLKLVKEFLAQKLGTTYFNFASQFRLLWDGTRDQIDEWKETILDQKLSTFVTDSRAEKFSRLVNLIFWTLGWWSEEDGVQEEDFLEMREQAIWEEIQEILGRMKKLLEED